jgi:hypothetical protein
LEYQELLKITNEKDLTFKVFYKITESEENQIKPDPKKLGVYFINGTFGSGKNKFVDNLAKYSKSLNLTIHVFKKTGKELVGLNNKIFVDDFLRFANDPEVKPNDIVIVSLPSLLNTKLIVDNITRMPEFTNKCELRSIVTKINLSNFYQHQHKEISENILTYCTAGYSQFILLDNYGGDESDNDRLSASIRNLFTHASVYRVNSNIIQEGLAKDILFSCNFESKINKIERKRNIPFKLPEKKYVYIPFKVPILQSKIDEVLLKRLFNNDNGYFFYDDSLSKSLKSGGKVEADLEMLKGNSFPLSPNPPRNDQQSQS